MTVREAKFAFGKELRLRKGREFRWVLKGERISGRYFTVVFKRGPPPSRIGLTVSRKVGKAIQRNRIKRVCRECFRMRREELRPAVALVVIARPGAGELDRRALWAEVGRVFDLLRDQATRKGRRPEAARPTGDRGATDSRSTTG